MFNITSTHLVLAVVITSLWAAPTFAKGPGSFSMNGLLRKMERPKGIKSRTRLVPKRSTRKRTQKRRYLPKTSSHKKAIKKQKRMKRRSRKQMRQKTQRRTQKRRRNLRRMRLMYARQFLNLPHNQLSKNPRFRRKQGTPRGKRFKARGRESGGPTPLRR